eukprot:2460050-Rhodomonas_salina.1
MSTSRPRDHDPQAVGSAPVPPLATDVEASDLSLGVARATHGEVPGQSSDLHGEESARQMATDGSKQIAKVPCDLREMASSCQIQSNDEVLGTKRQHVDELEGTGDGDGANVQLPSLLAVAATMVQSLEETSAADAGLPLKVDDQTMLEQLLRGDGWEVVPNDADGNCLYYAVLDQMNDEVGVRGVRRLRGEIADFLHSNESTRLEHEPEVSWGDLWEKHLDVEKMLPRNDQAEDWRELCKIIRRSRWGDSLELHALAHTHSRPIHLYVVREGKLRMDPFNGAAQAAPICLAYYKKTVAGVKPGQLHDVSHYFSIRKRIAAPPDGSNAESPLATALQAGATSANKGT